MDRLERIQNEDVINILGCIKDMAVATMRYLLAMPTIEFRHHYCQAYLFSSVDKSTPCM